MKYIYKTLIVASLSLGVMSCSDEKILDLEPINSISEGVAFSTPSLIASSVNGMYNAAAIGEYNGGGGRGYVWGAAYVQQNDNRGEDAVNTASFFAITYQGSYDATTANNIYYWSDGYGLINKCNLVIEGVTKAVGEGIIDKETGNDYIAQAKFLRAITHFEFLIQFAKPYQDTPNGGHMGVPYREFGVNSPETIDRGSKIGRSSVGEVYAKVLEDLDFAEANLKETEFFKATKNAAIAFKTRVYLHQRNWDKVLEEGAKIETAYQLTAQPSGVFDNNNSNTESIFSINQGATVNPGVNGALASMYKRRLLVAISPIIWNNPMWLKDDKRRTEGGLVITANGAKFSNKYRDETTYTDKTPIIRFAEVKLNMAEAYARLANPDLDKALTHLNDVRNRALADVAAQAYQLADLSSPEKMVKAIVVERRIEFVLEGRRWADIHRLQGDNLAPINGVPEKVGNGTPAETLYKAAEGYTGPYGIKAIPYTDKRFIWPIPLMETGVNPVLAAQQNPGY